jgi:HEPN domain-containing protein
VARHLYSEGARYPEVIAFHCQQATEKNLKAFLTWHSIEFPKTHNLVDLRLLAGRADESLAQGLTEITVLNPFGVEYRYPGDAPEMMPGEVATVFDISERAREAILRRLRGET